MCESLKKYYIKVIPGPFIVTGVIQYKTVGRHSLVYDGTLQKHIGPQDSICRPNESAN